VSRRLILLIAVLVVLTGCGDSKTSEEKTSQEVKKAPPEAAKEAQRVNIPFDLQYRGHFDVPPGVRSGICNGPWDPLSKCFYPPVHPLGTFESLSYKGQIIELDNANLQEGIIKTKEFGDFEVFMYKISRERGSIQLGFRAAQESVQRLETKLYNVDFIEAIKRGDLPEVKQLIDTGIEVNKKDKNGQLPLTIASGKGHELIVQVLLDKGANVNARNSDGDTPLIFATRQGQQRVTELLLDNRADVNARTKDGSTALMFASANQRQRIVALLLDRGADVNAKNNDGATALTLASKKNYQKVTELLIQAGAK
jgi:hypothetical protein